MDLICKHCKYMSRIYIENNTEVHCKLLTDRRLYFDENSKDFLCSNYKPDKKIVKIWKRNLKDYKKYLKHNMYLKVN